MKLGRVLSRRIMYRLCLCQRLAKVYIYIRCFKRMKGLRFNLYRSVIVKRNLCTYKKRYSRSLESSIKLNEQAIKHVANSRQFTMTAVRTIIHDLLDLLSC